MVATTTEETLIGNSALGEILKSELIEGLNNLNLGRMNPIVTKFISESIQSFT